MLETIKQCNTDEKSLISKSMLREQIKSLNENLPMKINYKWIERWQMQMKCCDGQSK